MVLKSLDNLDKNLAHNLQLTIQPAAIEDSKLVSAILAQSFYNLPDFASWAYPFLKFTINEDLRHRLRSQSPNYRCLVAKIPRDSLSNDSALSPGIQPPRARQPVSKEETRIEQQLPPEADRRRTFWLRSLSSTTGESEIRALNASHQSTCTVALEDTSSDRGVIANSDLQIVGTIEIALRSTSLWSNHLQYPYISNLAVAKDFRRLGIGSRLLTTCEQTALDWGYEETRLHVLDRNDSAKQLYCNNGYQISQIEANWGNLWFDYSPRLLLKKPIQPN